MTFLVRTADFAETERVEMWRDALSTACVPFEVTALTDAFEGEIYADMLGGLEIGVMSSVSQITSRTPRMISLSDQDYYKLAVQLDGTCVVRQDGRETTVLPGDLTIYDCTRPFDLFFGGSWRMLALMFPRPLLHLSPQFMMELTARRLPGTHGVGALTSALLGSLADHMEQIPASASQQLADTIIDLTATLLSAEGGLTSAADLDHYQRALIVRIKDFIDAHLSDPALTPEMIAAAHNISVRQLYKLFEAEGTAPARYLRERRLERCSRDLRDSAQLHEPISVLAARWGFDNFSHFSRMFKASFGESPRDYRRGSFAARRSLELARGLPAVRRAAS
ncbi:MAG: helix-turn-helix domain-containing protein [Acetobacteraceae bacterium]|nr:helix-turn-helix domain-containing protein [Acetobacteraceae bacterium]